jgi:hypothetical protein
MHVLLRIVMGANRSLQTRMEGNILVRFSINKAVILIIIIITIIIIISSSSSIDIYIYIFRFCILYSDDC